MILAVLKILSKLVSDVKLKWGKVFKRGDVNSVTQSIVTGKQTFSSATNIKSI